MKKIIILLFVLLTACQPSPEVIQRAIEQTQAAYTPTPEPTATPTLIPVESWRVSPYPGAREYVTDIRSWESLNDTVAKRSEILGVPQPFRWDFYSFREKELFDEVAFHYTRLLRPKGYAIDITNYIPGEGWGLLAFTTDKMIIYIEVMDDLPDYDGTIVLVMYKTIS